MYLYLLFCDRNPQYSCYLLSDTKVYRLRQWSFPWVFVIFLSRRKRPGKQAFSRIICCRALRLEGVLPGEVLVIRELSLIEISSAPIPVAQRPYESLLLRGLGILGHREHKHAINLDGLESQFFLDVEQGLDGLVGCFPHILAEGFRRNV